MNRSTLDHFCRFSSTCRCFICLAILSLCCVLPAGAQSVLYGVPTVSGVPGAFVSVNLVTCEVTTIATDMPPGNFTDFVMMPNGEIYVMGFVNNLPAVLQYNVSSNTYTSFGNIPGSGSCGGSMLALNDSIILMVSPDVISQFNINTGTITVLANIPGINGFGEMFEHNGQIYLTHAGCGNYPDGVYLLDLNPVTLTPVTLPYPVGGLDGPFTSVCNQIIGIGYEIGEYNIDNGTVNPLCDFIPPGIGSGFQSTAPNLLDDDGPLCNCTTESGTWLPPSSVLSVCGTQSITVNHAGDEVLDGDDNLVFILSTGFNPSSEPSNILGVFSTPSIPFIPGVTQFGTYYWVYAVAGNAVGAGVDYTDPCLEISPARVVRWLEPPSVTFTSQPGNCGGCQTLNVQLDGEAPFTLTYKTLIGGNVQGNFTQVFNSSTGTLQVCPPPGYTGPFEVVATQLLDDVCVCGQ